MKTTAPAQPGHEAMASRKNLPVLPSAAPASVKGHSLVDALVGSKVYQEYEQAFAEATGLPVSLQPVESWHLPHHHRKNENPFCAMMAKKNASCAACLRTNQRLSEAAANEPRTMACSSGLSETAVPLRLGDRLIGFLRTGQVFNRKPTAAQFNRHAKRFSEAGLDMKEVQEAYLSTRVVPSKKYESMVKMLAIFAQQLSSMGNQIVVRQENQEPPMVARAREYIQGRIGDKLSLAEVAKAVHTSTFYFCKMFKKATHLTFTNYVSRLRVERAKAQLLNPNLRVSEIAYETGFQSLTHFNRVFRKIVGSSPTAYRGQLPTAT